jgi:hypothetical protein
MIDLKVIVNKFNYSLNFNIKVVDDFTLRELSRIIRIIIISNDFLLGQLFPFLLN